MNDYPWPEWMPERVRKAIWEFWSCFSRTMEDWEKYVAETVPGGIDAVGQLRRVDGCEQAGQFVPMWNNIAWIVLDDGTVRCGSFEQSTGVPTVTKEQWLKRGAELFGSDTGTWRFRCPSCGHVQSVVSVQAIDPSLSAESVAGWIYYSCQGRQLDRKHGGCDWTLGGLFRIHKLEVLEPDGSVQPVFEFDEPI